MCVIKQRIAQHVKVALLLPVNAKSLFPQIHRVNNTCGMAPVYPQTGGEAPLPYPRSLSSVIGRSRTRMPVARYTALAMAAAVPTIPISPIPFAPIAFTYGSTSSNHATEVHPKSESDSNRYS